MCNRRAIVFGFMAFAVCVLSGHAMADTAQFVATEDAWIYGAAQSTNYGTTDPLELSGASGAYKRQCLFRWNLSSLGPVTIQSAQIVLTTRASTDWGGNLPAQLVKIDAAWNEMTVTWANRPATSTVATDTLTLNQAYADPWTAKTWTLNAAGVALVQSWANGQSNYGLQLMPVNPSTDSHVHNIRPREATDVNQRPRLIVTYLPECLPPGEVADLSLLAADATRLWLGWTAPAAMIQGLGVGYYELRYSTAPIDSGNFDVATLVAASPTPEAQGTPQTCLVQGLGPNTTYYFAMKCHGPCDGLVSGLSNVLQAATTPPDTTPPAAVSDLSAGSIGTTQLQLSWTATADNAATGLPAAGYDVRRSTAMITEANFSSATPVAQSLTPKAPGQSETLAVAGLAPGTTYYFAMKVFDEVPNTSVLSNVASATTDALDTTPPAAITDLATSNPTGSSVQLTWTAPGDDGTAGTAAIYDVRYSTSAINEGNWPAATQASGEPSPQSAGSAETFTVNGLLPATFYYFAVKTADDAANTSALSNVAGRATATGTPTVGPTTELGLHFRSLLDQPDNTVDPWAFAVSADIHIDYYTWGDYVPEIASLFTSWADAGVAFGLIAGDLGGGAGADQYDQPAHLMQVYHGVPDCPPLLMSFGNHECDGPGKGAWLEGLYPGVVHDLSGADWGRYRYWSFDYRGCHFICLDQHNCYGGSWYFDFLPAEEWQWLEQDLEANRGKATFVFFHEPVVNLPGNVPTFFFGEGQRLLGTLYRYPDVKYIFHGHLHVEYRLQWEGLGIIEVPRFDHFAVYVDNGQAQLCDINSGGALTPVPTPFRNITDDIQVPRVRLSGDRQWLYENQAGSTAWRVNLSATFVDDPYANTTYTYDWQAPVHSSTGQALALVAGGGTNEASATYAAPPSPSAHSQPYRLSCTVTGNPFGNSVTNTVLVDVRRPGDANGDGYVDVSDLLTLAGGWGTIVGDPAYDLACDINDDGTVDVADLLILAGNWGALPRQDSGYFACASDTHVSEDPNNANSGQYPNQNFDTVTAQLNGLSPAPDFWIFTGDMAYSVGLPGDYAAFKQLASGVTCPMRFVLGNHDNYWNFWDVLLERQGPEPQWDSRYDYAFDYGANWRMVMIDSRRGDSVRGDVTSGQFAFLQAEVDDHPTKNLMLFMHHHPTRSDNEGIIQFAEMDAFLRANPRIRAVLFGHLHELNFQTTGQTHLINVPATAYVFIPSHPLGFLTIKPLSDRLIVDLVPLNDPQPPQAGFPKLLTWN